MRRFVTYLFRYRNGEKRKNAGHIRIRIQNQVIQMQINIKDFELEHENGIFYVIVKPDKVYGIPLGEIAVSYGQYQGQIFCNCQEKNILLQDIAGVGISFSNGVYMASCWKDGEEEAVADTTFLAFVQAEPLCVNSISDSELEIEECTSNQKMEQENVVCIEEESKEEKVSSVEEERKEEKAVCVEEEPVEEKDIRCKQPLFCMQTSYRKINLNEIHTLSSRQWHLSNNSFLLHGFWNYGYLVLKESVEENKKKLSLGIPGIFEQPEMVMAAYFGFPHFEVLPKELEKIEIGEKYILQVCKKNQQPQNGVFGCWFVSVDSES